LTLGSDERQRASCFVRDDVRRRYVVSHAAVRVILGRYLGIEPGALEFHHGPHGKPRLAETRSKGRGANSKEQRAESRERHQISLRSPLSAPCSLHFNLAHSGELAVVALARGCEIGVDVERLRPLRHLAQLAQRYFTPAEAAAILALDGDARQRAFLAVWTAKEAILKALGRGLSYPLDRFAVSPSDKRQVVTLPTGKGEGGNESLERRAESGEKSGVSLYSPLSALRSPLLPVISRWWLTRVDVPDGYLAAVATSSEQRLLPTLRYPDDLG
jgi:4'-phosphopantetheinyl transferase